jgi:HD superfamily phosphohydrolase
MSSDFNDLLKEKYNNYNGRIGPDEYDTACKIIAEIEKNLTGRYEIVTPISIGGTGVVIKVRDLNLNTYRALKIPRPMAEREDLFKDNISSEILHLCEFAHQNIISVYYKDKVSHEKKDYPYFIMEYIDGAEDGHDYILGKNPPVYTDLISFLCQWVLGLSKLHEKKMIHGDVKLGNVLVSKKDGLLVKVSDFGSARSLKDNGITDLTLTDYYAHPELKEKSVNTSDPNRVRIESIERSQIKIAYDLYSLGKSIFEILEKDEYKPGKLINDYQRNYLTLLAARLLDGENSTDETFMTIPCKGMGQIKYENMNEVLLDLKKANGEYSINEIIPELNSYSQKTIQASSSGINTFTDRVSNLLNNKLVSRLANITQLGLMVYVYPTAVHTRFEHVLGTMLNVAGYIDALWHDPINPFFKQVITDKDIKKILVAALLHDIGQYALAHDFEEADGELFSHSENNKRLLTDPDICRDLEKLLKKDWDLTISDILPILGFVNNAGNESFKNEFLRSIIDGPIDADKLDYLIRDANNLNIPYGKAIDYSKILRSLTVVFQKETSRLIPKLGIHEKGKIAAEGIAFARYAMFGTVYWHHTVRSFKAMLHRAVWESMLNSPPDKRTTEYQQIKESIFNEINDQVLSNGQPWLIESDKRNLKFTGNMNPYDFKILSYFYEITSPGGKRLLEMICERKLYKRLYVTSAKKSEASWDHIIDRKKENDWRRWVLFQKTFENILLREIGHIKDKERKTTALQADRTEKVDSLSRTVPLFLIDVPPPKDGGIYKLQYLHEARYTNNIQNIGEVIQPEDSIIWSSIGKNLSESIGKARIFCHPEIIDTAAAFFTRDKIEDAILEAWQKTRSN